MDQPSKDVLKWVALLLWYLGSPLIIAVAMDVELFAWIWEYKSILFFAIAAFFSAVMDSIENEHIKITIFQYLPVNFWYKRESWNKSKQIFGYKIDAWHLSKSAMVICVAFAALFYKEIFGFWWDLLFYGAVWCHVFNGFYNHVFKK